MMTDADLLELRRRLMDGFKFATAERLASEMFKDDRARVKFDRWYTAAEARKALALEVETDPEDDSRREAEEKKLDVVGRFFQRLELDLDLI